jgi:hypothetical protein
MASVFQDQRVGGNGVFEAQSFTSATINCTPGNAAASGVNASIQQSGVTTINCSAGSAVAAGVSASIVQSGSITINCTVGNSIALGISATVSNSNYLRAPDGGGYSPRSLYASVRPPAIQKALPR